MRERIALPELFLNSTLRKTGRWMQVAMDGKRLQDQGDDAVVLVSIKPLGEVEEGVMMQVPSSY